MTKPALYGYDLFGEPVAPPSRNLLSDRFLVPPFSVLNAREGWWQERKQLWLGLGIKSEVSREAVWSKGDETVRAVSYDYGGGRDAWGGSGVSVFDPVLCELVYRWFCPMGGLILDPLAGGSVRGIVAHLLGFKYWGCDLRPEQIEANEQQATEITPDNRPTWICGDALDAVPEAPQADLIFSCPPYGDLERYSDDPRDLSTMEHHTFVAAYKRIVMRACRRLRDNRFACFVVADFRDKRGFYRDFVSTTIAAFREQRLELYNEAILVTAVGSLPVRIGRQFEAGRKLGKTHQNVLVFVKGDPRLAVNAIKAQPKGGDSLGEIASSPLEDERLANH